MPSKKIKIDISLPVYLYKTSPSVYDHPTNIKKFAKEETLTNLLSSVMKFLPANFEANIYLIFGKTYENISSQEIEKLLIKTINKKIKKDLSVHIYILSAKALAKIKKLAKDGLIIDNFGYGNVHNLQLITQILFGSSYQINLDDDEVIPNQDFFHKILEIEKLIEKENDLAGVGGLYLNSQLNPDISQPKKITNEMNVFEKRVVTQQQLINLYKKKNWHFPAGVIFGGLNIMSNIVAEKVCFDPNISRGEDIDFLISAFAKKLLFGFSYQWSIIHKPPKSLDEKSKLERDIIRFIYQKRKIECLAKKFNFKPADLLKILNPYPAFFLRLSEKKLKSDALEYIDLSNLKDYMNNRLDKEINQFLKMYEIWPSFCQTLKCHRDITNLFIKL